MAVPLHSASKSTMMDKYAKFEAAMKEKIIVDSRSDVSSTKFTQGVDTTVTNEEVKQPSTVSKDTKKKKMKTLRMTKADKEKARELKRNWNKSPLSYLESQKQYQRHVKQLDNIKPFIDTRPPFVVPTDKHDGAHATSEWGKRPTSANHGRQWSGTFVYENSLLSPRERHRMASWKGTEKMIPRMIHSPFAHNSADIDAPSDASLFAHGALDFEEEEKKAKNVSNTNRPTSAPRNRNLATPAEMNNRGKGTQSRDVDGRGVRSIVGGDEGEVSGDNLEVWNRTERPAPLDQFQTQQTTPSSGSGMNAVRTTAYDTFRQQQLPIQIENVNGDSKLSQKSDTANETKFAEELLIDRLPPAGLQAYDTLCKVLAQLDPADRVKVVECALIDSGEISKLNRRTGK